MARIDLISTVTIAVIMLTGSAVVAQSPDLDPDKELTNIEIVEPVKPLASVNNPFEESSFRLAAPADQFSLARVFRNKLTASAQHLRNQIQAAEQAQVLNSDLKKQWQQRGSPSPPPSLDSLKAEEAAVKRDIEELNKQLATANLPEDKRRELESKRGDYNSDLANYQRRISEHPNWIAEIDRRQKLKDAALKKIDENLSQIKKNLMQLYEDRSRLDAAAADADERISGLFSKADASDDFKLYVSMVFAGLVAFVIVGFFGIALRDKQVSAAIFSNEAGIQFVTLFSLVIAIILFGIVRILEGKELAALLGGLSGYILGRSNPRPPVPPPAPPGPPPAPPGPLPAPPAPPPAPPARPAVPAGQ
jgi:hypothetical protein